MIGPLVVITAKVYLDTANEIMEAKGPIPARWIEPSPTNPRREVDICSEGVTSAEHSPEGKVVPQRYRITRSLVPSLIAALQAYLDATETKA